MALFVVSTLYYGSSFAFLQFLYTRQIKYHMLYYITDNVASYLTLDSTDMYTGEYMYTWKICTVRLN